MTTNEIVGHCPRCGGPIYGPKEHCREAYEPKVIFSCNCRFRKGDESPFAGIAAALSFAVVVFGLLAFVALLAWGHRG